MLFGITTLHMNVAFYRTGVGNGSSCRIFPSQLGVQCVSVRANRRGEERNALERRLGAHPARARSLAGSRSPRRASGAARRRGVGALDRPAARRPMGTDRGCEHRSAPRSTPARAQRCTANGRSPTGPLASTDAAGTPMVVRARARRLVRQLLGEPWIARGGRTGGRCPRSSELAGGRRKRSPIMIDRIRSHTVTFAHPFALTDAGEQPAGNCTAETEEALQLT